MPRLLFIADVHLEPAEPAVTAGFLNFLQQQAAKSDGLYILGDLFEAWVGDDDNNPLSNTIAEAIAALTVPVYFIHGNRDFLLGQRFARRCHMQLLPELVTIDYYQRRILVMHGDTLCTDDIAYQRYRRWVHKRWVQKIFLILPLWLRKLIGKKMRTGSHTHNLQKKQQVMDVNSVAVEKTLSCFAANLLIHGHTHKPAIHQVSVGQRAVLGAWHHQGSAIQVDADGIQLLQFPF